MNKKSLALGVILILALASLVSATATPNELSIEVTDDQNVQTTEPTAQQIDQDIAHILDILVNKKDFPSNYYADPVDPIDPFDWENHLRGDMDLNGELSIDDLYVLVDYMFRDGPAPNPIEIAEYNSDNQIDISDLVGWVDYFFEQGVFVLDLEGPVVELLYPEDEETKKTSRTTKEVDFQFSVNDASSIDYCELIIDGDVEGTLNDPEKDTKLTIREKLPRGSYEWRVNCVDEYGNSAHSEKWDIEIKKKSSGSEKKTIDTSKKREAKSHEQHYVDVSQMENDPIVISGESKTSTFAISLWHYVVLSLAILIIIVMISLIILLVKR